MTQEQRTQWLVWWVIWVAFQVGIFVLFFVLTRERAPVAATGGDGTWMVGFAPVAVNAFVRWGMLPRVTSPTVALPLFIVGLALAEMTCFLGIFLFPAHRQELFGASVAGIFQFIPLFARRFFV